MQGEEGRRWKGSPVPASDTGGGGRHPAAQLLITKDAGRFPHTCLVASVLQPEGATHPNTNCLLGKQSKCKKQTNTLEFSLTQSTAAVNGAGCPWLSGWTDYRAQSHLPGDNCLNSPLHFAHIETVPIYRSLSD